MEKIIAKIASFHCPSWEELPDKPIFNHEVVEYINKTLDPIILDENAITPTIIQNYSKWGVIPKLSGRKYERKHISILMIVTIYKQILNIKEVKKGIELQLNRMDLKDAYNVFARTLEGSVKRIFQAALSNREVKIEKYEIEEGAEGVEIISNAFTLKLLGILIIQSDGFLNIGGSQ